MTKLRLGALAAAIAFLMNFPLSANGEDLFKISRWANLAGDQKAAAVGDILTVIVYQNAEARNAAQNTAQRGRSVSAELKANTAHHDGQLGLNGDYVGKGEVRRSESLVTQISVKIEQVLPNGDLVIAGEQQMQVNGERTHIAIRGRVRPTDINGANQVLSTRIADAEINYEGDGFVTRNSDSGVLGWLFSLLGLSG